MSSQNKMEHMTKIQQEGLALFMNKNKDYGDAFVTYGAMGVIARIGDKISRLQTMTTNEMFTNTETMRDTLVDLHNYAVMAIMLMDNDETEESLLQPYINQDYSDMKDKNRELSLSDIKNNHYK